MNTSDATSAHTIPEEASAATKQCDAVQVARLERRGMKFLRLGLALFMGAFAVAPGIAAFHLAVALLHQSAEAKTPTASLAGHLVGEIIACAVFAWFAFALWEKNRKTSQSGE
ncbi:MAG TPA: hypothetical protein VGM64_20720 [Lacunisphaera sp.]